MLLELLAFWPHYLPLLLVFVSFAILACTRETTAELCPSPSIVRGSHIQPSCINNENAIRSTSLPIFISHQLRTLRKYTAARLAISLVLALLALSCTLRSRTYVSGIHFVVYLYLSLLAGRAHHLPLSLSELRRRDKSALHLDIFFILTWVHVLLHTPTRVAFDVTILYDTEFALLTVASLVIPMIRPRMYYGARTDEAVEMDKHDTALPAEATASLLAFVTYSFLDSYILASRRSSPEETHCRKPAAVPLPDLEYEDQAEVLSARSEHVFDNNRQTNSGKVPRRRLLGQLLGLHLVEHAGMTLLLVLHVFAGFGAPFALQRLLRYLEHPTSDTSPAPWLALLFITPITAALLLQLYAWLGTRVALRVEGALMTAVMRTGLTMRAGASANPASDGHMSNAPVAVRASLASVLTTDLTMIREARDWLLLPVCVPLNVALGILFLYSVLGPAAFAGLSAVGLLAPVPAWFAARIRKVEVQRMRATDERVESVSETVDMLKMVKLFGWEGYTEGRIASQREVELDWLCKRRVLEMAKGVANFLIPVATMLATYATYVSTCKVSLIRWLTDNSPPQTLLMKQQLTAAKVFSSMAVFDILRGQFHLTFHTLAQAAAGKVSLDRVEDYLFKTELLDKFVSPPCPPVIQDEIDDADSYNEVFPPHDDPTEPIGFRNASFTWSTAACSKLDILSATQPFILRIEGEVLFPQRSFTLVTGPTGSGKTTLLLSLLGEMRLVEDITTRTQGWFNLPRAGGVAYAAQETWVLNDTIRNNIVFGASYNAGRYASVLEQCGLGRDLLMFPAGDATKVGEKGATLSGGQRARVTLARAVYSDAQVLLLDDVFAALDVHTIQWIIKNCFAGSLMKDRTIIFVTHNAVMAKNLATHVIRMGHDGRIANHGAINKTLFNALVKHTEPEETTKPEDSMRVADNLVLPNWKMGDTEHKTAKLMEVEEIREGRVDFDAVKLYLSSLGGRHAVLFFAIFAGGIITNESLNTLQTWFLGYWAAQYDGPNEVEVAWYLGVYSAILACAMGVYMTAYVTYIYGGIRASRKIHEKLVSSVIGTTFNWLDVTPASRIIARCTQDIGAVDGPITGMVQWLTELTVAMLVKLGAIVFITPLFLGPGIAVALFCGWLCQVYMGSQLSVKREMSNARAPILGHFAATMAGLVSIRAFGVQETFVKEALSRIDRYTRSARTFYNLTRWITIRLDFIGAVFTSSLAAYLVYYQKQSASDTGFSLNMSIAFNGMILYWVMSANELEVQGTSLERIQEYMRIEHEPKADISRIPPAYWPASGDLRVENLSARYSQHATDVLHNLTFQVGSGEHVGIVGRTGSGKSSLTLALLRSIVTSGEVHYDNVRTDQINLESLRKNVTIIPQVPEMLAGTLRQNLDPFNEFDDAQLNDALRSVGLFTDPRNGPENSGLRLDTVIRAGGSNISIGQRQILALARAIVRNSKLLILDEATSAIDHETDALIQSTLRHHLGKDVTVLIVAHRLHTVIDADKIMVLDEGHIIEFDSPEMLLKKPHGIFKALVENSGHQSIIFSR